MLVLQVRGTSFPLARRKGLLWPAQRIQETQRVQDPQAHPFWEWEFPEFPTMGKKVPFFPIRTLILAKEVCHTSVFRLLCDSATLIIKSRGFRKSGLFRYFHRGQCRLSWYSAYPRLSLSFSKASKANQLHSPYIYHCPGPLPPLLPKQTLRIHLPLFPVLQQQESM